MGTARRPVRNAIVKAQGTGASPNNMESVLRRVAGSSVCGKLKRQAPHTLARKV